MVYSNTDNYYIVHTRDVQATRAYFIHNIIILQSSDRCKVRLGDSCRYLMILYYVLRVSNDTITI